MSFFDGLWSAIVGFFNKDSVKTILKIGEKVIKMLVARGVDDLQRIAWQEVQNAESTGKSGLDKYEMAFKAVKKRFPEVKESVINLAIEMAVNALQSGRV